MKVFRIGATLMISSFLLAACNTPTVKPTMPESQAALDCQRRAARAYPSWENNYGKNRMFVYNACMLSKGYEGY